MKAIVGFFKNDHIQIAIGTGVNIIILALFFKRVLHVPVPLLESSLPAFVLFFYEFIREKGKGKKQFWSKPWFWIVMMFLVTGLVILRRLYL